VTKKKKRTMPRSTGMSGQSFQLLLARFDTIEQQNAAQLLLMQTQNNSYLKALSDHIVADSLVHKIVERHTTYFSIGALGIPAIGSYLANKFLGWKPF
jgi:hypothetical protein